MIDADPYAAIAARVAPGSVLVRRWPLEGGVSASVDAMELRRRDGSVARYVVRRHRKADWKPLDGDVTRNEYELLRVLKDAGMSVPHVFLLDATGQVLPTPYFVMELVEGTTNAADAGVAEPLGPMAAFLAQLHALDLGQLALPSLPGREDPIAGALEYLPDTDEHRAVRDVLSTLGPFDPSNEPALVHGDYWPGNVLWNDGALAAVIDWEDAAIGDPLSDLAGCRLELSWRYDGRAAEDLTARYLALADIDPQNLPFWELFVSAAAARCLGRWGLPPAMEASMRAKTRTVIASASRRVIGAGGDRERRGPATSSR